MRTLPVHLASIVRIALVVVSLAFCQDLMAQKNSATGPEPEVVNLLELPPAPKPTHKFWDAKNRVLFSTVVALDVADFTVTRSNLGNGGRELNPLVRPFAGNTAALATNFAGESAGVIAVSYLLHRTGHHRFERWTPVINAAGSAFAVAYGLAHH